MYSAWTEASIAFRDCGHELFFEPLPEPKMKRFIVFAIPMKNIVMTIGIPKKRQYLAPTRPQTKGLDNVPFRVYNITERF
jgi:hypothetical protein